MTWAQVNLLPQGNFENPGADTGWAEGFKIPNNQEFRVVSGQGKHWLRIENRDAGRQLDYVHAYVKVTPRIASLTVSARMRATNLKIGKEGWHTARIAMSFEGGSFGYPAAVPELRADSDWVTQSVELRVPKGATRLNLQPAMFYCTGVVEIADLTVTPHLTAGTEPGDAALPAGIALNWDKTDVKTVNAKRSQVSLDGIWRFTPATEGAAGPPKRGWAYIKVPGDWQIRPGRASSLLALASGPQWNLYDGASVSRAWYQRQVSIPANWQGRAISLRFDRVCTDAIVYVNGKRCGEIAWPWGSVDITSAVKPGQTSDIRVLVAAIADAEKVGTFWQSALSDTVTFSSAGLRTRGLTGRVLLESRSSEARVTDVFVRTSTRRKSVSLDVELRGVKRAGPVRIVADMLDKKGEVEKSFIADAAVDAKETQTLTLSWPWADPRLWDVGRPNLYTLRLKVTGAGLDDEYDQGFGFREFWAEAASSSSTAPRSACVSPAFTTGRACRSATISPRWGRRKWIPAAMPPTPGADLDDADRKGYLVAQYVLNANRYMMRRGGGSSGSRTGGGPSTAPRCGCVATATIRPWSCGSPASISSTTRWTRTRATWAVAAGVRAMSAGSASWRSARRCSTGSRQLDPTRVYYSHAGADAGDVYTMNCYLDLIPLQEREDWLSAWAESGEMPISMVEFGTPMDCTFRRGRHGFYSNITSEPLLTEYAAIYFGTDAYAAEEPKYRQYLRGLFRGGMLYQSSENRLG